MKLAPLFYILLFATTSPALKLALTHSEISDLDSPTYFLDPHNHKGGELPPLALINHKKYIYGGELSMRELKGFWSGIANFFELDAEFQHADRVSNGAKMFMRCNQAFEICSRYGSDEQCRDELVRSITNVLTATPNTSFNTAYAIRTKLKLDIPDRIPYFGDFRSSKRDKHHAFLFALAKSKADIVEMTKVFMFAGPDKDGSFNSATKDFRCYSKLSADLNSKKPIKADKKFLSRLKTLGLKVPRVKWLLMTHTLQLGMTSPTKTLTYDQTGQCQEIDMPSVYTDPTDSIYHVLSKYKDVVGVDVAGPETTCFSDYGMNEFKNLAIATYLAAKERKDKGFLGKLIVRSHVGEGFPVGQPPLETSHFNSCQSIQKFNEARTVHDRSSNIAIHALEARKNIGYLLNAIADLINKFPDIKDYVVFRMGHATHIDSAMAKQAKNLGVRADVNLSSNVATGAWPVPSKVIETYLTKNGIGPNNFASLLKTLVKNGATIGEIFDGHGLYWLLYHGVETTLGSDGGGVEHSDSLRYEYEMAEKLINFWSVRNEEFGKKKIAIETLLEAQASHYDDMAYDSQEMNEAQIDQNDPDPCGFIKKKEEETDSTESESESVIELTGRPIIQKGIFEKGCPYGIENSLSDHAPVVYPTSLGKTITWNIAIRASNNLISPETGEPFLTHKFHNLADGISVNESDEMYHARLKAIAKTLAKLFEQEDVKLAVLQEVPIAETDQQVLKSAFTGSGLKITFANDPVLDSVDIAIVENALDSINLAKTIVSAKPRLMASCHNDSKSCVVGVHLKKALNRDMLKDTCQRILNNRNELKKMGFEFVSFIGDFNNYAEELMEVCNTIEGFSATAHTYEGLGASCSSNEGRESSKPIDIMIEMN